MTSIDPHIFRAYDIRGKAHSQITADACRQIGRAFGEVLVEQYGESPTIVLGRDARTHSPEFEQAAADGLMEAGCSVKRIGETPSPVNYFSICKNAFDGGMQITASHNPKEDNGIKLCTRDADAFSGEDLQQLKIRIEKGLKPASGTQTPQENFDAVTPYIAFLSSMFKDIGKGLNIVIDAGNGVAGPAYSTILRAVGCAVTEMYTTPDGTFPNHAADPSKHSTLKELQSKVQEMKADCGLAFDGDGDRLGLVDEQGGIVTADQAMLLLAEDHLSRHAGKPVIFTVSNSSLLDTEVKKWGGVPIMCKVGHSFVEHAMREHKALLGGEQSGHFFCGEDYYGFDDAMVAALRVLLVVKKKKQSLSSIISAFPEVFQAPERRPSCPDDKKAEVVRKATEFFAKKYPVVTLDGARIDFGDGAWGGIRFSNTSPCLSICIEARSEAKLKAVEDEVLGYMRTQKDVEWER